MPQKKLQKVKHYEHTGSPVVRRATLTKFGKQLMVRVPARIIDASCITDKQGKSIEDTGIKEGQGLVFKIKKVKEGLHPIKGLVVTFDAKVKEKRERKSKGEKADGQAKKT
jgi:hypothetical protein